MSTYDDFVGARNRHRYSLEERPVMRGEAPRNFQQPRHTTRDNNTGQQHGTTQENKRNYVLSDILAKRMPFSGELNSENLIEFR
jgi:hypothetical protein